MLRTLLIATLISGLAACASNEKPVANAGADKAATTGTAITLDGSKSSDADDDPLTYAWTLKTKPSGSTATLTTVEKTKQKPKYTPDKNGDYVFELVVNDTEEDSDPDSVKITASGS